MNTLKLSMFWTIFTNLWIHCFRPVSCVNSSQDLYVIVYIEFGLLVHTKLTKLWWSNLCITPLTQLSSRGNQKMFYFAFVWSLSIRLHLNSLKMKKKMSLQGQMVYLKGTGFVQNVRMLTLPLEPLATSNIVELPDQ